MRFLILFLLFQSNEFLNDRVLVQDHQHRPAAVAPMTLPEIERAALENNREIRVMQERVDLAKAGVTPAIAIDDPSFSYRAWGTPLFAPWNVNQTQHMFMFNQTFPAAGKRELRYEAANQGGHCRGRTRSEKTRNGRPCPRDVLRAASEPRRTAAP